MKSNFITLKEVCGLLELSRKTVLKRERKLGLDKVRDPLNPTPIRYFRKKALEALFKKGYPVEA